MSKSIWDVLNDETALCDYVRENPHSCRLKDGNDRHPLHLISRHRPSLTTMNVVYNAYPQAIDHQAAGYLGHTPLYSALEARASVEVIGFLVAKYPEALKIEETNARSLPLHCACRKNHPLEVVELMARSCPQTIKETTKHGKTPLDFAKSRDAPEDVAEFLENFDFPPSTRIDLEAEIATYQALLEKANNNGFIDPYMTVKAELAQMILAEVLLPLRESLPSIIELEQSLPVIKKNIEDTQNFEEILRLAPEFQECQTRIAKEVEAMTNNSRLRGEIDKAELQVLTSRKYLDAFLLPCQEFINYRWDQDKKKVKELEESNCESQAESHAKGREEKNTDKASGDVLTEIRAALDELTKENDSMKERLALVVQKCESLANQHIKETKRLPTEQPK